MILAVLQTNWPAWIALVISSLALIGTLGNFLLTLWRGRRHIRIRSSQVEDAILIGAGEVVSFNYRCTVTNTGYIGLQIERVELRPAAGGNVGIELELAHGEQPRKLDQGEKQNWEKDVRELKRALQVAEKIEVIAVAVDTTGEEYVQK